MSANVFAYVKCYPGYMENVFKDTLVDMFFSKMKLYIILYHRLKENTYYFDKETK